MEITIGDKIFVQYLTAGEMSISDGDRLADAYKTYSNINLDQKKFNDIAKGLDDEDNKEATSSAMSALISMTTGEDLNKIIASIIYAINGAGKRMSYDEKLEYITEHMTVNQRNELFAFFFKSLLPDMLQQTTGAWLACVKKQ